jgi:hypothetical protein
MSRRDTKPEATPATEPETGEAETAEAQGKAAAGLNLSLEDTIAQKMRGVPTKTRTGVVGYNPYDAEPAKSKSKSKDADGKAKPTDLRKLSEWIRLQRQVAELNPDAPKKKPPT